MVRDIFKLLRPHQWLKNLFIFLPIFFGGKLLNIDKEILCLIAFISYSLACSSIYCLNDILDRKADSLHPKKKNRPIASGRISLYVAYMLVFLLFIASLVVIFASTAFLSVERVLQTATLIGFYYVLNIFYCIYLKRIAIVDVMIIATGFVLRVFVGGTIASVELSHWIIIMTFLLALFLAFAKRRDDVLVYKRTGNKPRANIVRYNEAFLNQVLTMVIAVILVAYLLYCVSPEVMERMNSSNVYVTAIFVLLGLLRYLQVTLVDGKSGSPTKVLVKDHFLQLSIMGWILSFLIILYL